MVMTTEKEKAKRYDEALEWMREVYPTLTGAAKEDAEHYFPELKESEDETHRKWILEYLYDGLRKSDEQFKGQFKSAIAWLEKQKENPKSADSIPSDCVSDAKCENLHNEEGDFVFELRQIISSHRYSDIYGEYINDEEAMASEILELCKCELEKQKEQKPITINQDEKEFLADEITAFLCNYDKEFDGEDPVPSEIAEHFYLLGKQAQEQKPEAKLTGWVARDKEFDSYYGTGLILFNGKPRRSDNCWNGDIVAQLPWELFPDLKWEDEPMEVEITIRKK